MSRIAIETELASVLRQRAVTQLVGAASDATTRATPLQALAVLHALASSPDTAHDALALLHELQVHQVEIELQAEELRSARVDLEAELCRQIELYERAPMGYMTLDAGLVLHELNPAGARILGGNRDELLGQPLAAVLAAPSAAALRGLLGRVDASGGSPCAELPLALSAGAARPVLATAVADGARGRYLVALIDPGPTQSPTGS